MEETDSFVILSSCLMLDLIVSFRFRFVARRAALFLVLLFLDFVCLSSCSGDTDMSIQVMVSRVLGHYLVQVSSQISIIFLFLKSPLHIPNPIHNGMAMERTKNPLRK